MGDLIAMVKDAVVPLVLQRANSEFAIRTASARFFLISLFIMQAPSERNLPLQNCRISARAANHRLRRA